MDYTTLASKEALEKTAAALTANSFMPEVLPTKEAALARIKELIPQGATVTSGASVTLQEIGYEEYAKDTAHGWNNLKSAIVAEADPAKQAKLRIEALSSQYYLGSVHALTETGELVRASASGSQLPNLAFSSPNIILVVSTQKIVPTLTDALGRIETQVVPLEDERMKAAAGYGTLHAKTLILHKEHPAMGRKVHVLLVEEKLGF